MRAFAYIRVSTGEQAKKHSLEAQREEIERYCAANVIEVLEWFEDHISGKKLVEREGLMEMLDRAGAEDDGDGLGRGGQDGSWGLTARPLSWLQIRPRTSG